MSVRSHPEPTHVAPVHIEEFENEELESKWNRWENCVCPKTKNGRISVESACEDVFRRGKMVYLSITERCTRCKARLNGYGDVIDFDTVIEAKKYAESVKIGVWEK